MLNPTHIYSKYCSGDDTPSKDSDSDEVIFLVEYANMGMQDYGMLTMDCGTLANSIHWRIVDTR